MIDWYTIEFLFPESFKRFTTTMFPNIGVPSLSCLELYDIKKLYRFFDNEDIFLTIDTYTPNHWVYTISVDKGICFGPGHVSATSRIEIEIEGFSECFKILDTKIRGIL